MEESVLKEQVLVGDSSPAASLSLTCCLTGEDCTRAMESYQFAEGPRSLSGDEIGRGGAQNVPWGLWS